MVQCYEDMSKYLYTVEQLKLLLLLVQLVQLVFVIKVYQIVLADPSSRVV